MPDLSCLAGEWLTHELGTDDTDELFTTARRRQAILEAELEFADLTECLTRESTVTTTNGNAEYDLLSTAIIPGDDFLRMGGQGPEYQKISSNSTAAGSTRRIAGKDFPRTDIERLNREQPGWRNSSGADMPTDWYLRADAGAHYFGLTPPPTVGSSEAASIRIPYVARPIGSTESTYVLFTVGGTIRDDLRPYHQGVVHYAAHTLEKLRRDHIQVDNQLTKFLGYVTRYLQSKRPKHGHRVTLGRTYLREVGARSRAVGSTGDPLRW